MSTLSLIACVCGSDVAEWITPQVTEAGTNGADVWIALVICLSVVAIAWIVKQGICAWKQAEIKAEEAEREAKTEKEKEEYLRKQKADLTAKLLALYEKKMEPAKSDGKDKTDERKPMDETAAANYEKFLKDELEKLSL